MVFSDEKKRDIQDAVLALLTEHGPQRLGELVTLFVTGYGIGGWSLGDFRDVNEDNLRPILEHMQDRLFRYRRTDGGISGAPYYYTIRTPDDPDDSFTTVYYR